MSKKVTAATLSALSMALLAFAFYGVKHNDSVGEDTLLMENVEALARGDVGSNGEFPRYINETEIKSHKDVKVELDSSGLEVEYSRTCSDVITYCEHTGKDEDICYESLNGIETICGDWSK